MPGILCYNLPMDVKKIIVSSLFFLLLALSGSALAALSSSHDDGDHQSILQALQSSISYFSNKLPGTKLEICGQSILSGRLLTSLQGLASFIGGAPGPGQLADYLADNFELCQPDAATSMLVTGYYQPVFRGSLDKTAEFAHPLYFLPEDEKLAHLSRAEIENSNQLKGHELIYLADPVTAFTLHIQGSGLVDLSDGSRLAVNYAGTNKAPYTSIGALLARRGVMERADITMPKIVSWLRQHPGKSRQLMQENSRFVFFELGKYSGEGPRGSMGYPLVEGRSVALDRSHYPLGVLAMLETRRPVPDSDPGGARWQSMARLVCHHDSGAAIKGPGRIDMFWGTGPTAGRVAGVMKEPGSLYLLLPR